MAGLDRSDRPPLHLTDSEGGRQPNPLATMPQFHLMQQWDSLSDPVVDGALIEVPTVRRFAGVDMQNNRIHDKATIFRQQAG
jgi:transposase, IS5 family